MKQISLNEDFLNQITEKVKEVIDLKYRPSNEVIIDDVQLRDMLKISRRTALNYRNSGKLKFYKIENKIFYFLSDVYDFLKLHQSN